MKTRLVLRELATLWLGMAKGFMSKASSKVAVAASSSLVRRALRWPAACPEGGSGRGGRMLLDTSRGLWEKDRSCPDGLPVPRWHRLLPGRF